MPAIIPPPPVVPISAQQEPPHSRVHFRIQQVLLSVLTVGATAWLWKTHPILGLAATFIAKHILVAILAAGLSQPPTTRESSR